MSVGVEAILRLLGAAILVCVFFFLPVYITATQSLITGIAVVFGEIAIAYFGFWAFAYACMVYNNMCDHIKWERAQKKKK